MRCGWWPRPLQRLSYRRLLKLFDPKWGVTNGTAGKFHDYRFAGGFHWWNRGCVEGGWGTSGRTWGGGGDCDDLIGGRGEQKWEVKSEVETRMARV